MNDLWGPIDEAIWQHTPCVAGRCATENDVAAGRAVFYVPNGSEPAQVPIPSCAFQTLDDGSELPVVIIQAESISTGTAVGVRPLAGGNSVCLLSEVRILPSGFQVKNAG